MSTHSLVTTPPARHRARRLAATLLLGVGVATCTRDLVEPGRTARLDLAPSFAPGAAPGGNALGIDQIRVEALRHSTREIALDKVFPFATGPSLQLDLSIPLKQSTDTFDLFLDYEHGSQVLFSGSQSAVAGAGASTTPISVLVSYVGPGTAATSMSIAPRDTVLTSGDALQLRLTVLDTATPDSVYVGWSSDNAGQAVDATGRLVASLVRGTVTIRAVSPTPPGLRDSTTVRIVPKPAAMVKVSGDGQTGVSGQALPQPLVVQVNGSDLLGVPGVTVTFSVASGGGSVDTGTVVTDSLGRAGTVVTLGASGVQAFKATAGALSVTFSETGGAAPPRTWTGAVSTDWNTAGNWSPAGVPGATDSVIVPSATNQPHVHTGAFSVHGISIQSGALVTLDTVTLTVVGSFTDAGGVLDPNASSAISLAGSGTVSGNANAAALLVPGSYTLTGDVQGGNVQVNGSLTLGGHALVASSSFVTAGTGVVIMTNAADTLYSQGAMAFGGGAEGGKLLAGTVVVQGGFSVTSIGGFVAGTGVTTVFNGSAVQVVTVVDSVISSTFGNVDFNNPAAVALLSLVNVAGDVTLESKAVVASADTTFTGQGLAVKGNITTIGGSFLKMGRLYVNAGINFATSTYATTAIILTGSGQTLPAGFTYPFVYVGGGNVTLGAGPYNILNQLAVQGGSLTLGANLTFPGNTFVQLGGTLILNGHTLSMGGNFTTNLNGVLKMTNPSDTLIVGRDAFFGGASEAGQLTAGGIVFGGNFVEGGGDAQAFVQSGTARSAFINGGSVDSITFAHPGAAGASHFNDLGIGNPQGALKINSDVWILGHAAFLAGAPKIVSGGGEVVHFANLSITGVIFNDVAIAYDAALGGANLIALDTITFENYDVNSATPLIDITSPGNTASPGTFFLFDNMTFLTDITGAGGTGHYLRVTDSAPGDGNVLTIDINSGLVVTEGIAHTVLVGGAVVNWAQP